MVFKMSTVLKNARVAANLTQQQVSDVLKVKKNTISNYENNVSSPDMDSLAILCELYGLDMGAMLNAVYGSTGGKGLPSAFSANEIAIIEAYRQAGDDDKNIVDSALRKYKSAPHLTLVTTRNGGLFIADAEAINRLGLEMQEDDADL